MADFQLIKEQVTIEAAAQFLEVTDEDFDKAMQQIEEGERWRAANPERYKLIEALTTAIAYLGKMGEELRGK